MACRDVYDFHLLSLNSGLSCNPRYFGEGDGFLVAGGGLCFLPIGGGFLTAGGFLPVGGDFLCVFLALSWRLVTASCPASNTDDWLINELSMPEATDSSRPRLLGG
ncbi:hypothetical protein Vretifemale_19226 [Volvox reticuliferus]|nr:hypothetical protein Vretifemale_19226 [Volvox reticuliferus]